MNLDNSPQIGSFPPAFSRGARATADQMQALRAAIGRTVGVRRGSVRFGPPLMEVFVYRHRNRRWKAMAEVADVYGVRVADMIGIRRFSRLTNPRHVAAYAMRAKLGMSLPQIGDICNRDHTTVFYACRKVERMLADEVDWLTLHRALGAVDEMIAREARRVGCLL